MIRRPPRWFTRALQAPFEDRFVTVQGCRIHYLRWGLPGKPGLVFVHGGFAHAHWWDGIAPAFLDDYTVAAIDLSGMGDSGHRDKYSGRTFASEVMAVCSDAGSSGRPIVIGHSFGGLVALKAAALYGQRLTGALLVDFPIRPARIQREHDERRLPGRRKEIYPSVQAALARFRLIPAQPCENKFMLEHIARHSMAQVNGGWSWKFDERMFDGFRLGNVAAELAKVRCLLAVIYGEHSALFPPEIVQYMWSLLGDRVPMIRMRYVHHHLYLEQPLAFVRTIREILDGWRNRL